MAKASTTRRPGAGTGAAAILLAAGVIAAFEGYRTTAYADPIGIPTACYGHTGPEVEIGQQYTKGECDALLSEDIASANADVHRCISAPMRTHQEAALTSAAFNAGPKIVCGSTLQRKANAGDWAGACAELDRWVYARGWKLAGLVRRRAAERALCEGRT